MRPVIVFSAVALWLKLENYLCRPLSLQLPALPPLSFFLPFTLSAAFVLSADAEVLTTSPVGSGEELSQC